MMWFFALSLAGLVACGGGGDGGTVPGDLTDVQAIPRTGFIEISWDYSGTANRFEIFRETLGSEGLRAQELTLIETLSDGDRRSYADTDVSPDQSYAYAVAVNGGAPVPAEGSGVSPEPGNLLRVLFASSVPGDATVSIVSDPAGIDCSSSGAPGCEARFASISTVALAAEAEGLAASWENCDSTTGGTCTVTMATARNVTVSFTAANTLSIDVQPSGIGRVANQNDLGSNPDVDCTGSCTYTYPPGLIIGLQASPVDPANYELAGWGGACSAATGSTCTVTMDDDRAASANFQLIPPVIDDFSASPARIVTGASSTLSWSVSGGGSIGDELTVTIEPGVGEVGARSGSVSVSPTSTTTYTLTASNASGTVSDDLTVVVGNGALVESFGASPEAITPSESTTLSWTTSGTGPIQLTLEADGVTVADVSNETSYQVSPDSTTTYTLVATNAFGSDSDTTTVRVGNAPVITSIGATDPTIQSGEQTLLEWSVTGTEPIALTIDQGVGDVTGQTSEPVSPTSTTTYTLTAESEFGSDSDTVTVTVGDPPTIESFTADDTTVARGGTTTLRWNVSGENVTLALNGTEVSGQSQEVSPDGTTSYMLEATNAFGAVSASVVVEVGDPPAVSSFTASPEVISSGGTSELSWSVTGDGDLKVTISPDVGTVPKSGSTDVAPTSTTVYTLTAESEFGTDSEDVTVTVGDAPTIDSLTADDTTVATGGSTVLRWTVSGEDPDLWLEPPGIDVSTQSSYEVFPTASTTYVLEAVDIFGSDSRSVDVQVGDPPAVSSFTASPEVISSGGTSALSWTVTGGGDLIASISPDVGTVAASGTTDVTPTSTTEYVLEATSEFGAVTDSVTVTVGTEATIGSFSASDTTVTSGETVELTWSVDGEEPIELLLEPLGVDVSGATTFSANPEETTTYTLLAENSLGSDQADVTVEVGTAPSIEFSASDETITTADSTTLSWNVTGAGSVEVVIEPELGSQPLSGSESVSPDVTTEYVLSASSEFDTTTAAVTIEVGEAPVISAFEADPSTTEPGGSSLLSWDVVSTAPLELSIDPEVGDVTGTTQALVEPETDTTYTLMAVNDFGTATDTVEVLVEATATTTF